MELARLYEREFAEQDDSGLLGVAALSFLASGELAKAAAITGGVKLREADDLHPVLLTAAWLVAAQTRTPSPRECASVDRRLGTCGHLTRLDLARLLHQLGFGAQASALGLLAPADEDPVEVLMVQLSDTVQEDYAWCLPIAGDSEP